MRKITNLEIQIRYLEEGLPKLQYIGGQKSDWIDMYARKDMKLEKGDFVLIPLGVAIKLPAGYEAHLAPRSSTFKNFGIIQTNSVGIIDQSYCGNNDEWMMPVYATRKTVIHKGDRICQFRIMENQPTILLTEVDTFGNKEGRGGFGSTGIQ